MTNTTFDAIKARIKNDPTAVKTNWWDGHKWEDTAGNWYGWEAGGFIEYVFYAGEKWERRTDASGNHLEPVKVA